jgi:hypothetical protein
VALSLLVDTLQAMRRWFWIIDATVVILFVVIGREDHGFISDIGDYVRISAPFLIGLGATIGLVQAWRRPTRLLTGLALALGTLVFGMVLRRFVWDAGTARTFVLVTAGFLVVGMVGWRLLVMAFTRWRIAKQGATT